MTALPKIIQTSSKPRLSVRTAARFLRLPALEQVRILHDQKYPRQAPQVFKQPYYQPALTSIREVISKGPAGIADARALLQRVSQPARRMHSIRVLEGFASSDHAKRGLRLGTLKRYQADLGGLELRLSPDLVAHEGDEERFIYFNFKAEQYDSESAKMTLEIAHWLLEENGVEAAPEQVEFIDLFTGTLYKVKRRRARTIRLLEENAKLIESLWPTIDP